MMLITGNTYPVKDALKALGGRWNKQGRGWDVPSAKAEEARALVAQAGPSTYRPRRRRSNFGDYDDRDDSPSLMRNPRGRCEDAPCCGCCS